MYKVIIVDDNIPSVEMVSSLVDWKSLNCDVCGVAYDGQHGGALIASNHPDIIISDIHMPGLDGLKMIETAQKHSPGGKVIFISAYDDFSYAVQAIKLQAVDYLLKPFRIENLTESIQKAVRLLQADTHLNNEDQFESNELEYENMLVNRILEYVNLHIAEQVSLSSVADAFNYCPSYISSLIKKETGRNFTDWLTGAKIQYAKKLLRNPSYNIEEISALVGYKNYISFYRLFAKETGMSPSDYKKTKEEEQQHET